MWQLAYTKYHINAPQYSFNCDMLRKYTLLTGAGRHMEGEILHHNNALINV